MSKKIILCVILLSFFVSGCRLKKEKMGFFSRDQLNIKTAEKILEYISTKDSDKLKGLFSEISLMVDTNIDEEIGKLFSYCDGKVTKYEKFSSSMETSIDYGKNSSIYYTIYEFVINEVHYYLYFIYTPKNDFQKKLEGVKTIRVLKVEDRYKYFCYWEDMKPGIFVPE